MKTLGLQIWGILVSINTILIIWRIVDLAFEIVANKFTINRFGLYMQGKEVMLIELIIIALLTLSLSFLFIIVLYEEGV